MDSKDYSQTVKYLKHIYPFASRDWKYTRNLSDLKRVTYDRKTDKLPFRIKHTAKMLFVPANFIKELKEDYSFKEKVIGWYWTIVVGLRRVNHLPDGVIDSGSITTLWEEAGEYIQLVSPQVGDILVEWLENDSDNPYAERVVEKMKSIIDDYAQRAEDGFSDVS